MIINIEPVILNHPNHSQNITLDISPNFNVIRDSNFTMVEIFSNYMPYFEGASGANMKMLCRSIQIPERNVYLKPTLEKQLLLHYISEPLI